MKTPMIWCADMFPMAMNSAKSPKKLPQSFGRSIIDLANASATDHLTKSFRKPGVERLEYECTRSLAAHGALGRVLTVGRTEPIYYLYVFLQR